MKPIRWGGVLGVVLVVLVTEACLGQADDGFRARVTAGCQTAKECEDLERDAHNRHTRCSVDQRRNDCKNELADRQEARRLLANARARDAGEAKAAIAQHRTEYDASSRERQRLNDVAKLLNGRCEDEARVAEALASPSNQVPPAERDKLHAALKERAVTRRRDHVGHVEAGIRHRLQQKRGLESRDDLSDVAKEIESVKAEAAALKCQGGPDDSAAIRAEVDQWAADLVKQVATEEACRANAECLGARVAKPLCETIVERRNLEKDLAQERANPAGVVNLNYLHQLGSAMQDADRKIADLKKDYAATAKRPFSEAACKNK